MPTIGALAHGRPSPARSARGRRSIRPLPEQRGASGQHLQASLTGSPDDILAQVDAYAAADASELVCFFAAQDLSENLDDMRRFAAQVRAQAR
ncbi:MAG: hypothetical protein JO023_14430 [Chloroflexi bacterium]|nr:hypothetical protein [Chloroflexota bacterium]